MFCRFLVAFFCSFSVLSLLSCCFRLLSFCSLSLSLSLFSFCCSPATNTDTPNRPFDGLSTPCRFFPASSSKTQTHQIAHCCSLHIILLSTDLMVINQTHQIVLSRAARKFLLPHCPWLSCQLISTMETRHNGTLAHYPLAVLRFPAD